jgi:hypothetical protein
MYFPLLYLSSTSTSTSTSTTSDVFYLTFFVRLSACFGTARAGANADAVAVAAGAAIHIVHHRSPPVIHLLLSHS